MLGGVWGNSVGKNSKLEFSKGATCQLSRKNWYYLSAWNFVSGDWICQNLPQWKHFWYSLWRHRALLEVYLGPCQATKNIQPAEWVTRLYFLCVATLKSCLFLQKASEFKLMACPPMWLLNTWTLLRQYI